jgi:hypothetical protein
MAGYAATAAPSLNGTVTALTDQPGDQVYPRVGGSIVAYINNSNGMSAISYYDFRTGTTATIPQNAGDVDDVPATDGQTIVFTRYAHGGAAIESFDPLAGGSPVEIDPQANSPRSFASVGGTTVAWQDFGFSTATNQPEIAVYDRTTGQTTRLTNDTLRDFQPVVSRDGSVIVWTKCSGSSGFTDCAVWQAVRSGMTWTTLQLAGSAGALVSAATDGKTVVYIANRNGDDDIYWQPVGGGPEQHLALAEAQRSPSVAGNLISFETYNSSATWPNWDMMVYDIATGQMYHIGDTPVDEEFSTIDVSADGTGHVVWDAPGAQGSDVYAYTFHLLSADSAAPTITISAPTQSSYMLKQQVAASYSCTDEPGGSGLAACSGTVPNGSAIDTASTGGKMFTVAAADNAGNTASQSVSYNVTYRICALYDTAKAYKLGSTVPLKIQLCDANSVNTSAQAVVVQVSGLAKVDNTASSMVVDAGNANPENDFRFDATLGSTGGYIYNLSTKNLTTGTWALSFTATGDPVSHAIQFDVR